MKRDKWTHHHINHTKTQQMKPKLSIPVLLVSILLSLPLAGCGTILVQEGEYKVPDLPKSELAIIQIDKKGGWFHQYNLIVLRIGGKLALRKQISGHGGDSTDEVLVAPGKHYMSMSTIHKSFEDGAQSTIQTTSRFSADVKAGGIYLLRDEGELVDADTDTVVSESKLF